MLCFMVRSRLRGLLLQAAGRGGWWRYLQTPQPKGIASQGGMLWGWWGR